MNSLNINSFSIRICLDFPEILPKNIFNRNCYPSMQGHYSYSTICQRLSEFFEYIDRLIFGGGINVLLGFDSANIETSVGDSVLKEDGL